MDAVHNPENQPWISDKINLKEHFAKFEETVFSSRSASAKKGGDLKLLSSKNVRKLVETVQGPKQDNASVSGNPYYSKEKDHLLDDKLFDLLESSCDVNNLTTLNEVPPMQQFLDPGPTNRSESTERQQNRTQYPKYQVNVFLDTVK